jgi:hypothetical protein
LEKIGSLGTRTIHDIMMKEKIAMQGSKPRHPSL